VSINLGPHTGRGGASFSPVPRLLGGIFRTMRSCGARPRRRYSYPSTNRRVHFLLLEGMHAIANIATWRGSRWTVRSARGPDDMEIRAFHRSGTPQVHATKESYPAAGLFVRRIFKRDPPWQFDLELGFHSVSFTMLHDFQSLQEEGAVETITSGMHDHGNQSAQCAYASSSDAQARLGLEVTHQGKRFRTRDDL
jgi:hypothetical protein